MPGYSRHVDFAFSSTLINAFDPCSTITRKRQWQLNTDGDPDHFVPVKRKRKQQQPSSLTSQQNVLNAQGEPAAAVEKSVDYLSLMRVLEALSGQALFERLVTLPLPQVWMNSQAMCAIVFIYED